MLPIGRFAKKAQVSPRTIRFYESIGLLQSSSRGSNNYRYYDSSLIDKVRQIRDLQELGFSLEEIKHVLQVSPQALEKELRRKLSETDAQLESLRERRERLKALLSVSNKIGAKLPVNETERGSYMEAIHEEILRGLKARHGELSGRQLRYLERDQSYRTQDQRDFLEALRKCLDFAKARGLRLGPSRGGASASIVLHAMGASRFDPVAHDLVPERLLTQPPNIHIDVEFARGQEFVEYCRSINQGLKFGEIQAFKMPLLDILGAVDKELGVPIDYDLIPGDSDQVLSPFRRGDVEKIFQFDFSEDALIMKFENFMPGYGGKEKMQSYLRSQTVRGFRDIVNITALWRPFSPAMVQRLETYRMAKDSPVVHSCLSPELRRTLEPNFGMIIYHEDLLRIIAASAGWDFERSNRLRRALFTLEKGRSPGDLADFQEFHRLAPAGVGDLLLAETPASFCQPHAIAFSYFTKATAVLQNSHRELYFREVRSFEDRHGFRWDDIGVNWSGVSILQN